MFRPSDHFFLIKFSHAARNQLTHYRVPAPAEVSCKCSLSGPLSSALRNSAHGSLSVNDHPATSNISCPLKCISNLGLTQPLEDVNVLWQQRFCPSKALSWQNKYYPVLCLTVNSLFLRRAHWLVFHRILDVANPMLQGTKSIFMTLSSVISCRGCFFSTPAEISSPVLLRLMSCNLYSCEWQESNAGPNEKEGVTERRTRAMVGETRGRCWSQRIVIVNDWLCVIGQVHVLIFWFCMYLMNCECCFHSGSDVVLDMWFEIPPFHLRLLVKALFSFYFSVAYWVDEELFVCPALVNKLWLLSNKFHHN